MWWLTRPPLGALFLSVMVCWIGDPDADEGAAPRMRGTRQGGLSWPSARQHTDDASVMSWLFRRFQRLASFCPSRVERTEGGSGAGRSVPCAWSARDGSSIVSASSTTTRRSGRSLRVRRPAPFPCGLRAVRLWPVTITDQDVCAWTETFDADAVDEPAPPRCSSARTALSYARVPSTWTRAARKTNAVRCVSRDSLGRRSAMLSMTIGGVRRVR